MLNLLNVSASLVNGQVREGMRLVVANFLVQQSVSIAQQADPVRGVISMNDCLSAWHTKEKQQDYKTVSWSDV